MKNNKRMPSNEVDVKYERVSYICISSLLEIV